MKLAIVVVYFVAEENERLLDLHLDQIERHTKVPYTIYASANRLLPRFRPKLEKHPRVQICDYPTTELRGREEHSYYLQRLVQTAIDEGASHVVTLHVDSFPVQTGWAQTLAQALVAPTLLAMPPRYHFTACLFFSRDFYLLYQPTFLLTDAERASAEYKRFSSEIEHVTDSGYGYAFRSYTRGLTLHWLAETNRGAGDRSFGTIYDDLVFHLHSAALLADKGLNGAPILKHPAALWLLSVTARFIKVVIPDRLRWRVRRYLRPSPMRGLLKAIQDQEKARLLADPDVYLNKLRDDG